MSSAKSSVAGAVTASIGRGEGLPGADHAKGGKLIVGIKFDQPGTRAEDTRTEVTPGSTSRSRSTSPTRWACRRAASPSSRQEREAGEPAQDRGGRLIFATYSITPERQRRCRFAGPYFIAHQDLLVRSDNKAITGPKSLTGGKKLCSVTGSTSAQKVKDNYAKGVQLQEYAKYSDCVGALSARRLTR